MSGFHKKKLIKEKQMCTEENLCSEMKSIDGFVE